MRRVLMTVHTASRALGRNKVHSALAMLGVIVGVGAVIAMVAIGQGAQASIRTNIASLGAETLVVLPGSMNQSGVRSGRGARPTLRAADAKAIQHECPAIAWATPLVRTGSQVAYANQNWATTIQGVGVGLGAGGAQVLSAVAAWPALISWSAVALAVVFSGAVGISFGLYPACQAARLEPIQALRYE